jgi:hypothetical protein
LVGGAMVMINFHVELCVESYAFHPGTSLGKRRLSPNWYQDEMHRKCCRQDIFQVADVSCLENIVSEAGRLVFEPSNMIRVLRSSKPHAKQWDLMLGAFKYIPYDCVKATFQQTIHQ